MNFQDKVRKYKIQFIIKTEINITSLSKNNYYQQNDAIFIEIIKRFMRVKLEPETAFIGKKFAYSFLAIIFVLNAITFIWFFLFSNIN